MAKKRRRKSLFPELDEIVSRLRTGEEQDLLILFVPSHDRKQHELSDQPLWAQSALELVGELFGGATAFSAFSGVYKSDDSRLLYDKPILIESYVRRADLENRAVLTELLRFAKRMGRETNQKAVGIVVNRVFHYITDFSDR